MSAEASKTSQTHTPGPWIIEPEYISRERKQTTNRLWIHNGDANGMIASVNLSRGGHSPDGEANARLIAAAPELYELLRQLLNSADATGCSEDLTVVSAAAIDTAYSLLARIDGTAN